MLQRGVGRVGRPGVIRTAARTAVVAGTATALVNGASRPGLEPEFDAAHNAPAASPSEIIATVPTADPKIEQLKQLTALKEQGVLTADEFAAETARVLG